ncbi:unnamed protein product [Blumeria hordei]|uniref:Uncharacterized protein n=1 Tax=Blumeria hordei TaxID=2867405 RepID=A0A383USX2_BLUHO|nr:unnamed protein product [Blumeria hordei]
MKFLAAALIASLIGMSASHMEFYDDDTEFNYNYKLPVLNPYFRINCYGSSFYTESSIRRYVRKAKNNNENPRTRLETYSFIRFPSQDLLIYKIGDDRLDQGIRSQVFIIIDTEYTFLAGMIRYPGIDPHTGLPGTRETVCKFGTETQFTHYTEPR